MAEIEGLEPDLALTFFKKKGFNVIKEYHIETMNTLDDSTDSEEPLLVTLLMECVQKHNIPIKQVICYMLLVIRMSLTSI